MSIRCVDLLCRVALCRVVVYGYDLPFSLLVCGVSFRFILLRFVVSFRFGRFRPTLARRLSLTTGRSKGGPPLRLEADRGRPYVWESAVCLRRHGGVFEAGAREGIEGGVPVDETQP